jgi:putative transposase
MDSKMQFIDAATKPGARVAKLCRQFGISRDTGYRWINRFKKEGYTGLEERSRAPHGRPYTSAEEVVAAIIEIRKKHPRWGPKKLFDLLRPKFEEGAPSQSTIARVLKRVGQVRERRKRRPVSFVDRAPSVEAKAPNDVWTVDFKGWWRAGDGNRCEPLTVRDAFSRFILAVQVMDGTSMTGVWEVFKRLFKRYGLPTAIQCDNGIPFIQVQSRGGLSALSAWWISLGIKVIRSRPGCPQDNGGHERMHRDLKADVQDHPQASPDLEQRACDKWRLEFNDVRPHEALGGKVPAEFYRPSQRKCLEAMAFAYPEHWLVRRARGKTGIIAIDRESYFIGKAFVGHVVALEPLQGLQYRVWFRDVDLGEIELAPPGRMIDHLALAALDQWPSRTGPRKERAGTSDQGEVQEIEPEGSQTPRSTAIKPKKANATEAPASLATLTQPGKHQPRGGRGRGPSDGRGLSEGGEIRAPNVSQAVQPI